MVLCLAILATLALTGNAYAAEKSTGSLPGLTKADGVPIYFAQETPESVKADVLSTYRTLPESVMHEIRISDFHYIVLPSVKTGIVPEFKASGYSIAGEVLPLSYTVYSSGAVTHSRFACVILYDCVGSTTPGNVMLHETGHMLHTCTLMYGSCTQGYSEGFINLANQYQSVLSGYDLNASVNTYSNAEIFAESMRVYLSNPEWLKTNCPGLADYMGGFLAKLPAKAKATGNPR